MSRVWKYATSEVIVANCFHPFPSWTNPLFQNRWLISIITSSGSNFCQLIMCGLKKRFLCLCGSHYKSESLDNQISTTVKEEEAFLCPLSPHVCWVSLVTSPPTVKASSSLSFPHRRSTFFGHFGVFYLHFPPTLQYPFGGYEIEKTIQIIVLPERILSPPPWSSRYGLLSDRCNVSPDFNDRIKSKQETIARMWMTMALDL